jgi:hypothetical protein
MAADISPIDPAHPVAANAPWWRFGIVWFALSGPALVIVAGFATMAIAYTNADTELHVPTPVSALAMRIGSESRLGIGSVAPAAPASPQPAAAPR